MLASMPWTIGTNSKYKNQAADLINSHQRRGSSEEADDLRGVPIDIARKAVEPRNED